MDWIKTITGKALLWSVIIVPTIAYIVLLIFGWFFSYSLIFSYRGCSYDETLNGLSFLKNSKGEEIAYTYSKAPIKKYLVLYFHGNGEDIGHISGIERELLNRGASVMAMDYPDYGLSEGKPTEKTCYEASSLLYTEALKKGCKPEQIIIWGRSIGSGIATDLASKRECRALVLDSPFATASQYKPDTV